MAFATAINPAILYWGTPVVIISTVNEDGTSNLAPMSSAFWLADRCILGLAAHSQTTLNILRTGQCVLNLASDKPNLIDAVNGLAKTTGTEDVPESKLGRGYRYVKDKFAAAKVTPLASELVEPPRIQECSVQMEAEVVGKYDMLSPQATGVLLAFEVRILRTYVMDDLRMAGYENRVDPDKWSPLIMSFQQLYGLKHGKVGHSVLGEIDEDLYRPEALLAADDVSKELE